MLPIIQLIVAILLIICILLQQRGSGLGAAFGGEGSVYRTKRGAEKFIFTFTIILVVLFLGLALINVYLNTNQISNNSQLPQETETTNETPDSNILMEGEDIETKETTTEEELNNSNIFEIGLPRDKAGEPKE